MSEEAQQPESPPRGRRLVRLAKGLGLTLLGLAGGYLLASAAAAVPLSTMLVRPQKKRRRHLAGRRLRDHLRERGIRFKEVHFNSFDGTRLDGWFLEHGWWRPTIIALHGVTGNRTSLIRFGTILHEAGFNVFLFDGRGHGDSEEREVTYGFHEVQDVGAAIDFISQRFRLRHQRFGLVGLSMGAAIALQTAARDPRIGAVWAESPFASLRQISAEYISDSTRLPQTVLVPLTWAAEMVAGYRGNFTVGDVSPLAAAEKITCPVQLVHGLADDFVRPHHSEALFEALVGAPHKNLWLVEGAAHTRCYALASEEYRRRLVSFFRRYLGR